MSSTSVPPPPERRVPVVVPMVPRLAEEGGGGARADGVRGSGGVAGISPSILIIAIIVVVMLLASISIHYFIRSLCRHSSGSSAPPLPLVAVRSSAVAPAAAGSVAADQGKEAAAERERLIERLPLFTLASSLAALPRSSRDCAVCQCVFGGEDELRLLPACRHAFHSRCVDPWLRANPSCPLCRASIALPHPPLPELLRIELGSVSSRRSTSSSSATVAAAPPEGAAAAVRAYPLPSIPNSTTEYLVEEDVQVVLKPPCPATNPPLPTARITGEPSQQLATAAERGLQQQPSSSVTPTASFRSVGRSSSRWSNRWSSRWSSGRWSSRYDAGSVTAAATAEWWWDMDGGVAPAVARRGEAEDGSAFYGFVRWLTGAY